MIFIRLLALVCVLVLATSCGRWVPGYIVTDDGEVLSNNDRNMRDTTVTSMRNQLDEQLGGHWRTDISLTELPVYQSDERDLATGWKWAKANVSVTLIGDGKGDAALTNDEVTKAVFDFMYPKVERPKHNLIVTTTSIVDTERFARPVTVVEKPTTTTATVPNTTRQYTVQAGDTYADLSLAFYGSITHWRVIAQANNTVELTPGMKIIIPPKP
jgi:LysM repeat protein